MKCTWKDCGNEALFIQTDSKNEEWSRLCKRHHLEMDSSIEFGNPKQIIKSWMRASGGAKKLTKKMLGKK